LSNPIIGIDPGLGGALALLRDGELEIYDMPTIQDGTKRRVDHAQLAVILDVWAKWQGITCVIEKVASMPGNGHAGAFTFGRAAGVVIGAVAANFIPIVEVTPQVWKRKTQTPTDKDGARLRASELFPRYASQWSRVKDDGRAEAAIIAYYGREHGGYNGKD
jgi:crossover junction endodeoxyribonuclease RuvC